MKSWLVFSSQHRNFLTLGIRLHNKDGQRLYLTPGERQAFLKAAKAFDAAERTLCETLARTGCRPSEALELTKDRIDFEGRCVLIESKKKRKRGIFRAVPVPPFYLDAMSLAHRLQLAQKSERLRRERIWRWKATKAYYIVKEVMAAAGISGAHASPKGLRHGFAVNAALKNVPLPKIRDWMGHQDIEMTAVYLAIMGEEEYTLAERMWQDEGMC